MNQKILNIILIVTVVILVGVAGYFILMKKSENATEQPSVISPENYSTKPLIECEECKIGKDCCPANFEKDCASKNGIIRETSLHPMPNAFKYCFQKAPDARKECASGKDCLSGSCDLQSAIRPDKCSLIKKEQLIIDENEYPNYDPRGFFIASYSFSTPKPGTCTETESVGGPSGGFTETIKMEGKTLIETVEPAPLN